MSQDRKWEVVHTALLCTVHPQMARARLQHVLVDNRRTGAGRRLFDHASGGEAPGGRSSRSRGLSAGQRSEERRGGGGARSAAA